MIIVQSPLRISLFGGGTDFPSFFHEEGGCVLSCSIDKSIYVIAKHRFDRKLRIAYTRTELVDELDQVQHELIRESMRMTGVREGVEISTMGDIPSAGSGLGSSSTVTVGTLLALYALIETPVTPQRLAQEACEIELGVLGKPIGVQDQYIAAFGGLRFIEFGTGGRVTVEPVRADPGVVAALNRNLMLFYSGITRKAETVLAEQQANIGDRLTVLRQMRHLAHEARKALELGELDVIGELLDRSWSLKRQLATRITNDQIEAIYHKALSAGALGGKITGAGGGGFVLLYCPEDRQRAVREALADLQELPFHFESDGARVIFERRAREPWQPESSLSKAEAILPVAATRANGSTSIKIYLAELRRGLDGMPIGDIEQVIDQLHQARMDGHKVFIMGNGGSASTASHFACDLGKNTRMQGLPDFRVMALTDNMATFSALANDEGYENVFVGQLANLMETDDVVIGISTSGNSPNVVRAVEYAALGGAHTVGLTGASGGRLARLVDLSIKVPNQAIGQVEDIHLMLEHLICTALNDRALQQRQREHLTSASSTFAGSTPSLHLLDREGIQALYQFNHELTRGNGADGYAGRLLMLASEALQAESGSMIQLDPHGGVAGGSVSYAGYIQNRAADLLSEFIERGLAGWAVRKREAVLVSSTKKDQRWLSTHWESSSNSTRSAVTAPVLDNGHVSAVLTLARAKPPAYTERDLALLRAIALCASLLAPSHASTAAAQL